MRFWVEERLKIDLRKGSSIWFGKVLEKKNWERDEPDLISENDDEPIWFEKGETKLNIKLQLWNLIGYVIWRGNHFCIIKFFLKRIDDVT
jgi:hypothetical protein